MKLKFFRFFDEIDRADFGCKLTRIVLSSFLEAVAIPRPATDGTTNNSEGDALGVASHFENW
jgi:hypothetical protein